MGDSTEYVGSTTKKDSLIQYMGTNFYRRHIPTEDDYKKLHSLIIERKLKSDWEHEDDPYDSVANLVEYLTGEGVHICKRSWGWQVSFDHNWGKYYQPCRADLERFLSEPGYGIFDEYGAQLTPEQFWKEMDEHNANPASKFTSKTYDEYNIATYGKADYKCREDIVKVRETFGIVTDYNDFEVDGLRFAVFSGFC